MKTNLKEGNKYLSLKWMKVECVKIEKLGIFHVRSDTKDYHYIAKYVIMQVHACKEEIVMANGGDEGKRIRTLLDFNFIIKRTFCGASYYSFGNFGNSKSFRQTYQFLTPIHGVQYDIKNEMLRQCFNRKNLRNFKVLYTVARISTDVSNY